MSFLRPFQDLNVASSSSEPLASAITTPLSIPKLEPKSEPFDESLLLSSSSSSFNIPAGNNNGFSEFSRISDLFNTVFSERLEQYTDASDLDPDYGAILPVPENNPICTIQTAVNHPLSAAVVSHRPHNQRSSELVRVTNVSDQEVQRFREVIKKTRMLYDSLRLYCSVQETRRQPGGDPIEKRHRRPDLKAAAMMMDRGLWLNREKRVVGPIPGILVGDIFFYRMELCLIGLHGQVQAGIDYLSSSQSSNGEPIATSVISSGGYEDDEDAGDVIIYTGQGGQDKVGRQINSQKLEGGNLALERSMSYGIEIRVIRGIKYPNRDGKVFVYDGLYKIAESWLDVGRSGFGVYKYKLVRIDGQPGMGSMTLKLAQTLRDNPLSVRPNGYLSFDFSKNVEKVPIALYNDIDNNPEPLYYDYLVNTVYPPITFVPRGEGTGCYCVSVCNDDCLCAMKNGGEFAYDFNGNLLRGKPLIYECGVFCQCPPNCRNRVTQKGLRHKLEIFRSVQTSWGVRSLDVISAGAFICEYTGVALTREQAQILSMNGDSLIYPNRFSERWREWGDLSQIFAEYVRPNFPSVPHLEFALDVSRMRNVACYMSHSTNPNVLVQLVLYDHNNVMFPHLMLFATENIAPLTELSLDYGVDDDSTGNLSICN